MVSVLKELSASGSTSHESDSGGDDDDDVDEEVRGWTEVKAALEMLMVKNPYEHFPRGEYEKYMDALDMFELSEISRFLAADQKDTQFTHRFKVFEKNVRFTGVRVPRGGKLRTTQIDEARSNSGSAPQVLHLHFTCSMGEVYHTGECFFLISIGEVSVRERC
jgi:hypothetical protein